MCMSSKLQPIYSAFSLNQFMDAPHCQNGQKRVLPRDITLNKSKVLWYFRRLVFVLLYLTNCIFTTVTSAKLPLREGITLQPSPFWCMNTLRRKEIDLMYIHLTVCISTIFMCMKAESWRIKRIINNWKYFFHLGVNILLSCMLGALLHNVPVVSHWKPSEWDLCVEFFFILLFFNLRQNTWTDPWSVSTRFTQ